MFLKKYKILISVLFLSVAFIITPGIAKADVIDTVGQYIFGTSQTDLASMKLQRTSLEAKLNALKTIGIQVVDNAQIVALQEELDRMDKQIADAQSKWNWEKIKAAMELKNKDFAGIFYKNMVGYFLNTLAIDTATYLATGDKGQQPMFETDGWGAYIKNTADEATGSFIEAWGKEGPLKFNLCQPDPSVMIKIGLGLRQTAKPKKPTCTFSQLANNWEAALKDKDFLPKFQDMFNPWSNDLGIALTVQTGMESDLSNQVNERILQRTEGQGLKAVTDPISKTIKSPSRMVASFMDLPIAQSTAKETTFTGTLADAVDIFINTLTGKLIDKWMKKGLITDFPNAGRWNSLTDPNAQNQNEGIAGAENRFRSLTEPNFKVRGDYDILAELTMCPNPNKAGPTNCVIEEKFRQAIEKRLTVGQAMDQGYLNANGVFGFTSNGLEPRYNEGYPYRSMLILRKFRIIPVGWEIAAQKIKDRQSDVNGTKNLRDLVDCFSAADEYGDKNAVPGWCEGLVDPNWVLKAPQNFCKKEGAGPEILSEQVTGEGAGSSLSILRNDAYCADEQSLIKENSDGSDPHYGYCVEERRTWDFNGKSCQPRDNTCQTFQNGGQTVSYLQNTLDYGNCSASNAGCTKYAVTGAYSSGTVNWSRALDDQIYLNKNAESCDAADEGCHELIRITPGRDETFEQIEGSNTRADVDKAYGRFASGGRIYEKLLPDYFVDKDANGNRKAYDEGDCYDGEGRLKASAPARCFDFARQCARAEVGCEMYTAAKDGLNIPAKVEPENYCPGECSGYNTFIQSQTFFENRSDKYFIPKTAKSCGAETAGCDQFTNLDEVSKGGEGIEHYSYLRQCVKPNAGTTCGEFYSWEGSDESGFQLKRQSLAATAEDSGEPILTVEHDEEQCNALIYNLPLSDPQHNGDCRQFYNRAGGVFYRLYSSTKDCAEDCHPYRRTADDDTQANCLSHGGAWLNSACVYQAVPNGGKVCSAAQAGCREYAGNSAYDLRNIFTDDFEDNTRGAWDGIGGSVVAPSNTSRVSGGHSILININSANKARAMRKVGAAVTTGKNYILNFEAKTAAAAEISFSLINGQGKKSSFGKARLSAGEWATYKTSLANLAEQVSADEYLSVEADKDIYLDNITLVESPDRYYLIKNSWNTPISCDNTLADPAGAGCSNKRCSPLEMLNCSQYSDRSSRTHYLKEFASACSESAVGCELMIDTKNSTATTTLNFNNSGTEVSVGPDSFIYAVYDQSKLCARSQKGCALLGKAYSYESQEIYGDVYLKNNPDNYGASLCGANAVGCQTFVYDQGEKYFKDPGDQVCEWRRESGAGDSWGWFKKKVKRCGGAGSVCLADNDCSGATCQPETTKDENLKCDTTDEKTLGLGGTGGRVSQPSDWAGVCTAAASGCGEYIDPMSKFNNNLIFNGSFQNLATSPWDGWSNQAQNVTLEPNTVYRLARIAGSGTLTLRNCPRSLYEIKNDDSLPRQILADPETEISVANASSKIFYYRGSADASCEVWTSAANGSVELKKAVIDYQLKQNLDSGSCNGQVDFNKGCVLFNERSQAGASLAPLKWDAQSDSVSSPTSGDKANLILKVTPDRVCDKWLAPRSYAKDEKGNNVVYDVGLCDAMDDKGDCASFLNSPKTNQTIGNGEASKISNLSGYATAGIAGGSLISDYYPFGAMAQVGDVANLANGGFEFYGSNLYPVGWSWSGANKSWDANVFSVVSNPIAAQTEGIGRAPEGRAFIKLGSSYNATSEELDVMPNTDYIITAYVNTKNLKSGAATIDINGAADKQNITQNIGNDWQFQVGKFKTGGSSRIKIVLSAPGTSGLAGSEGNFYFDDIKIRPALESRDDTANNRDWYTTQSCRLYSKTDSLACDYYEDSGNRQKGWYGYCLQYDRAPGDPNACLLWYPIDKVKGDGIEEGAGYQGKAPVYYCTEAKALMPVEYRGSRYYWTSGEGNDTPPEPTPTGYRSCCAGCGSLDTPPNYFVPDSVCLSDCSGNVTDCNDQVSGWYPFNGFHEKESSKGVKFYDPVTNKLFDDTFAYCSKVVQTVNTIGDNKYWSSRVYKGSDWKVLPFNYQYNTDGAPFGAIMAPTSNPYDWDGAAADGIQPLLVQRSSSGGARASSPYNIIGPTLTSGYKIGTCEKTGNLCLHITGIETTAATSSYELNKADCAPGEGDCVEKVFSGNPVEKLRMLFAKSYGAWKWNEDANSSRYVPDNSLYTPSNTSGTNWELPGKCSNNIRTNPTDFCAVTPSISNIKINGSGSDVTLTKNGFVNLTFNSDVDSNQLPLTMYAVDWGDDSKTTVTGVEMRDRPEAGGNPHSLYHLYSYWDLKAKANRGIPGVNCSVVGECRVQPKVQIKDNWGWYSKGTAINLAGGWDSFGGQVVVREK